MRYCLTFLSVLLFAFGVQARDLFVVETQEMSQAVKKEFAEQGLGEEIEVELFGGKTEFVVENADTVKIMITNLDISQGQSKFTAKAEIFADGKPVAQTKLYGRYFVMTEVMLPVRDIAKDSIIKKEDLIQTSLRVSRLREDMVTQESDLVGKQAVHLIKANKPVQKKDIRDKVLIKKGQVVT
ncbi:MAG: flagella basal body P-ring formation protein FlgA, partial [Alphaproteobacteria bacterium]|nr:flagella basal body P-ring formation protein FlgA [Alphaproteobacteria bacterium]